MYFQATNFQADNSKSLQVLQKGKVLQPWITGYTGIYNRNGHTDYCSQIELKVWRPQSSFLVFWRVQCKDAYRACILHGDMYTPMYRTIICKLPLFLNKWNTVQRLPDKNFSHSCKKHSCKWAQHNSAKFCNIPRSLHKCIMIKPSECFLSCYIFKKTSEAEGNLIK